MPKGDNVPASRMKKLCIEPSQLQVIDEFRKLPACHKNDPEAVRERLSYYFQSCQDYEIFPSIEGLSLCLGISRQALFKWSNDTGSESGMLVVRAKEAINMCLSQGSMSGAIPFVYGIFQQKANFGYRDKDPVDSITTTGTESAISDKIEAAGLVWSEQLQDFILDRERDSEDG